MKAHYRVLNRYKYALTDDYRIRIAITGQEIHTRFIDLGGDGTLVVKRGYAWDGPSGPTLDTISFMRGSLVHDALYQLMRDGDLPDLPRHRRIADRLLALICIKDGMLPIRALWVYLAVRAYCHGRAVADLYRRGPFFAVPVRSSRRRLLRRLGADRCGDL